MRSYIAPVLLVSCWLVPGPVLAWTEAKVTAVSAVLDVTAPDQARVDLDVSVKVRSGWLSSFDLEGLAPDLELDPNQPASVTSSDGVRSIPELVRGEPGYLGLRWLQRRDAPKPGDHVLHVTYTSRQLMAAAPGERSTGGPRLVHWTLPRWPARLSEVNVRVIGPPGMRALRSPEQANFGETVASESTAALTQLTFTRAELPRTEAWRIGLELPAAAPVARAGATLSASALARGSWPAALGALLGLLVVAKRRSGSRVQLEQRLARRAAAELALAAAQARALEARARGDRARAPLEQAALLAKAWRVPLAGLVDLLAFSLCALAPVFLAHAPSLALACALCGVACALERKRPSGAPAAVSSQRALASSSRQLHTRSSRWFGRQAWLDATTPAGALLLGTLLGAALLAPEPIRSPALACAWLAVPLFFVRTRLHSTT